MMPLHYSDDVRNAKERKLPIVALETTILSHGMPYPQNLETARDVEAIVRHGGGVPATIAILDGAIRVGLTDAELERLATAKDVLKLSRADLGYALSTKRDGATTVAATMLCAHLASIDVFATGGIGGVHRGGETTMDISADLEELARTPVAVVCAGAKALLDIPKTLEVLETRGVPVVGYGTDEFPAFWSRSSGLRAPLRFDTPAALAHFIHMQRSLGITAGTLVANPIAEAAEIPAAEMTEFIHAAIAESVLAGVVGKAVTPWLLDRIFQLTGGRSLTTNIALVKGNARLATALAVSLAQNVD
jgi:pseudouridylate synthase